MKLTINNLVKTYKDTTVLKINSFQIESGRLYGIIGPNGAGKSTLVRILAGLEEASFGTVAYDDAPLNNSIYRKMTMVFQKPYLLRTSVFNNIAYPLKIRKYDKNIIETKVNEILEEMEIQHISSQNAWTLSGGEAQKVALARAIVFQPSLLILDEPTANIDPASIIMMEKSIEKFHQKSKATIVIVTHNLHQAKRLCQEVAFMNKGDIIETGSVEDVILSPQNKITKKFVEGEVIL